MRDLVIDDVRSVGLPFTSGVTLSNSSCLGISSPVKGEPICLTCQDYCSNWTKVEMASASAPPCYYSIRPSLLPSAHTIFLTCCFRLHMLISSLKFFFPHLILLPIVSQFGRQCSCLHFVLDSSPPCSAILIRVNSHYRFFEVA